MSLAGSPHVILGSLPGAFLALAIKGTLVFVLAYAISRLSGSFTAEHRHTLWLGVLLLLAVLPVAQLCVPAVRVPVLEAPRAFEMPAITDGVSASSVMPEAKGRSATEWGFLVLAGLWAAGAAAVGIRPAAGRLALARMLRSDALSRGPDVFLKELAHGAGVHPVRVYAHPRVTIPFTFGIFRPMVFLPCAWPAWTAERLAAVLLHELAHVKRRDALSNVVAQAACTLVWFHPLAWVARVMLSREAELSCDREVLSRGISCTDYASAIVEILRNARGVAFRGAWSALGSRKMLRDRLTRILSSEAGSSGTSCWRRKAVALALCLAAAISLLSVSFRATDKLYGIWERPDLSWGSPDDRWASAVAGYTTVPQPPVDRYAWNENGTGYVALSALPDVPTCICRFVIQKKWTDTTGCTWYHIRTVWSSGPFTQYTVIRISPSGASYEMTDSPLSYPSRFIGPPGDEKHRVYVRL
jgi:beta-lactamase regulating signal transducer with metallopeptidase domain